MARREGEGKVLAGQREVRIVEGVPIEPVAPLLAQRRSLALETRAVLGSLVRAAAHRLVVVELRERSPYDRVARFPQLQTKIDVVERHREGDLVEAPYLIEHRFAREQAGGGDAARRLEHLRPRK